VTATLNARVSKQGNPLLRTLLVQSASYILQTRRLERDLKRFGQHLMARGGKAARQRAAVAVARKLAVLLHRLWITGETYEPLKNNPPLATAKSAKQTTPQTKRPSTSLAAA
jgi:hypothetical protein